MSSSNKPSSPGTSSPSVSALLSSAHSQGALSQAGLQVLNVADMGAQIQAGLGVHVDDVESSEVVLVSIMPDDSGSIRFAGHAQIVRDGHNMVVEALMESSQRDDVLIHNRFLNGDILYPFVPLEQAVRMTSQNYDPCSGTPLYDQSLVLLGGVVAKTQEFMDAGVPVRTVTLIISDGADVHSQRASAADVRSVVRDLLASEQHIIAAMGIDDGDTDFRQVFSDMGIGDRWILTPGNSETEIRQAFQLFSQSAVKASQATSFSRAAVAGFVN